MEHVRCLMRERIREELIQTTISSTIGELMVSRSSKANIDELQTLLNCSMNLRAKELEYEAQIKCWLETTNTVKKSLSIILEQAADKIFEELVGSATSAP